MMWRSRERGRGKPRGSGSWRDARRAGGAGMAAFSSRRRAISMQSLLLVDACERADAPELGFVAGLALFDAASALTGLDHPRLSLKWPNDLLIDGKKCAGILLEGHALDDGGFALVIGIGVNVAVVPPGMPQATMLGNSRPTLRPSGFSRSSRTSSRGAFPIGPRLREHRRSILQPGARVRMGSARAFG